MCGLRWSSSCHTIHSHNIVPCTKDGPLLQPYGPPLVRSLAHFCVPCLVLVGPLSLALSPEPCLHCLHTCDVAHGSLITSDNHYRAFVFVASFSFLFFGFSSLCQKYKYRQVGPFAPYLRDTIYLRHIPLHLFSHIKPPALYRIYSTPGLAAQIDRSRTSVPHHLIELL